MRQRNTHPLLRACWTPPCHVHLRVTLLEKVSNRTPPSQNRRRCRERLHSVHRSPYMARIRILQMRCYWVRMFNILQGASLVRHRGQERWIFYVIRMSFQLSKRNHIKISYSLCHLVPGVIGRPLCFSDFVSVASQHTVSCSSDGGDHFAVARCPKQTSLDHSNHPLQEKLQ